MWYFLVKYAAIDMVQYRALQTRAILTETELFSEPYANWYIFSIEKDDYKAFINYLDIDGIAYDLHAERPTRDELLAAMR